MLAEAADELGMPTVYVDLFSVASLPEVAVRIEEAYRASLQGPAMRAAVAALRLLRPRARAGIPGAQVELAPQAEEETQRLLGGLLDLPKTVFQRTGARSLIVFDEFQDVLSASDRVDGLIRSRIQHHSQEASYVFAGSHPGFMQRLFTDPRTRRPLYDQASPVPLEPLRDEDLADYIAPRFERARRDPGVGLEALLDLAEGHPQRAMLLSYHLWDFTAPGQTADPETWAAARERALGELREPFEVAWNARSGAERRVLVAVAGHRHALLSDKTLATLGVAKTTARDARDRLLFEGVFDRQSGGATRFVDPLFELWVRAERRSQPEA